jgi:hypothetical protein
MERLRKAWRDLKSGPPGRRFQSRYERARKRGRGTLRKWLVMVAGTLLLLAGVVFLPLPGPGILIIAAGGLLMAECSQSVARAMDWVELRIRSLSSSLQRSR